MVEELEELKQVSILGFTLDDLKRVFTENGFTNLDAKRVFRWIHPKLAKSFDIMSDVPKNVREKLPQKFSLERPICRILQESSDGTRKALLEFEDKQCIETVFIPSEDNRNTICVSTQIGCAMGCKFCNTGTQKFCRNLTSSEILAQIIYWIESETKSQKNLNKKHTNDESKIAKRNSITNIVFMGMGEPLLNAKNLFAVLEILLDEKTYNFSRNKITVSTSGIVSDSLTELAKFGVRLAISLHAPNDEKRSSIMPINKKYCIADVLKISKEYFEKSNISHITFEYLLLSKVNDSDEDAIQLARLLKNFGTPCRVNLIIYNNWSGSEFEGSSNERANNFSKILLSKGIRTIIRKSRGKDIMAACGQLKSNNKDKKENEKINKIGDYDEPKF